MGTKIKLLRKRCRKSHRREFLRGIVVAGGAAGLALVSRGASAHGDFTAEGREHGSPAPKGYRETAHIREYYAKARF
jgi:hypothetical protein